MLFLLNLWQGYCKIFYRKVINMNPFEKNDFYITDFIEALKIVKSPLNTLVTNKNRKHWALALKKNGTTVYHFNNSDYIADKFHPILLPKHGCYTWMCTSPGECLMFEFECNISSEKPISFLLKIQHLLKQLSAK